MAGSSSRLLAIFVVLLATGATVQSQFCSKRPGGCCPGRDDACTAPRGDSLCYCDEFCLRSKDPDCCPDVFNNCTGLPATESPLEPNPLTGVCVFDGRHYLAGDSFKVNCNICTCRLTVTGYELQCGDEACLIREDLIVDVNSVSHGWTARNYSFLWGLTLEQGIKHRLGTAKPGRSVAAMQEIEIEQTINLPTNFDSRQKWPGLIEGVMDQGDCGSSWATSTTAVASDRQAIQSQGFMGAPLSPQHLVSCNTRGQRGCNGGHLDRAWFFMRRYGVVTEQCYPYRSGIDLASKMNKYACAIPLGRSGPCPTSDVTSGRYRMSPPYRISAKEEDIKQEIFTNGPLQAVMEVKEDFYSYAGGVYRYTRDSLKESDELRQTGYHSIRLLGWGVDTSDPFNPIPYWLCANSWGSQWGEDGYFRILRGTNECQIESFVLGVWGDVDLEMMHALHG